MTISNIKAAKVKSKKAKLAFCYKPKWLRRTYTEKHRLSPGPWSAEDINVG